MSIETIQTDLTWVQKHEKIIIVFMFLIALSFGFNKYINYEAKAKETEAIVAAQVEKQKEDKVAADKAATDAETQKYQALVETLERQNSVLTNAIQNANLLLAQRQKADDSLSTPDLVSRWETLINDKGLSVSSSGVLSTPEAAHKTVGMLESVPVLEGEVQKGTQVLENKESELGEANKVNLALTNQNKDDILLLESKDKECQTEVSAVKASETKSKRNWFLRGIGVGAAIVAYVAFHL